MFSSWYATDPDCCQHMRHDGTVYEMIQCVWLDMTRADRENGAHEYVIVRMDIDLNDYDDEDKTWFLETYGYTLEGVLAEYEEAADSIIAECILEESILRDINIIDVANLFDEAKEKIEKIIKEEK